MGTIEDGCFDRDLGEYLKECRIAAGWSQSQVARLLGITFQQVQKYETGTNRLPANRYPKLAEAIGFYPATLLMDRAEDRGRDPNGLSTIVQLFVQMSSEQRADLIDYASGLIESQDH